MVKLRKFSKSKQSRPIKGKKVVPKKVVKPRIPPKKAKKAVKTKKVKKVNKKAIKPKVTVAPVKKKKQIAKVPSGPKGYTEAENKVYKDAKIKYSKWGNQKMKDLLRSNLQSMSGNKDQLVDKCADGAALGAIPRCPKCFGGRPKFDRLKGVYHCSGYRDDEDFKQCHSNFNKDDIKRQPWKQ